MCFLSACHMQAPGGTFSPFPRVLTDYAPSGLQARQPPASHRYAGTRLTSPRYR